jgi:hypothetical protein
LHSGGGDKKCRIKEGIVFAFHNNWDGEDVDKDIEKQVSRYGNYARERLRRPEYHRIRIGLARLNRTLALIEDGWQRTSRHHALRELENALNRQHEIEKEAENIEDLFLRGYVYEQLDMIAGARRSLAEEVRWDVESEKKSSGII